MPGNVTISFRSRIEAGENTFEVPIQRKFADDPNRQFGFESITLMPEYQNTQAFVYNMDPKTELETVTQHPIQLEIVYGANYYHKDTGKTWSYLTSQTLLGNLLKSINQYYDRNKPPGTLYPPVFFDWVHLMSFEEDTDIRMYPRETALEAYGEEFSEAKHGNWLPPSLQHMDEFNNCDFPTMDNDEYLDNVRIRMWVAPNTTITFSNNELPLAMGFEKYQIPEKSKKGQVPFENKSIMEFQRYFAADVPLTNLHSDKIRGTKINAYTTNDFVLSPMGSLQTSKQRERYPEKVAEDYSKSIRNLAKSVNLVMNLEYDKDGTKKFKIVYPNNDNVAVKIYVPQNIMKQLGFDDSSGEFITSKSVSIPIVGKLETEELEKKAIALVYDTGMVTIDLVEQHSQLSSHSGNTLMATLHPKKDGTLRNRVYHGDVPRVHISGTNPDLKFAVYRFDDENRKMNLGWPVGAYIFGSLTGKV